MRVGHEIVIRYFDSSSPPAQLVNADESARRVPYFNHCLADRFKYTLGGADHVPVLIPPPCMVYKKPMLSEVFTICVCW